jgi:hypothetical protein
VVDLKVRYPEGHTTRQADVAADRVITALP